MAILEVQSCCSVWVSQISWGSKERGIQLQSKPTCVWRVMIFSVAISPRKILHVTHDNLVRWQVSRRMLMELAAWGPQTSYCCASVEVRDRKVVWWDLTNISFAFRLAALVLPFCQCGYLGIKLERGQNGQTCERLSEVQLKSGSSESIYRYTILARLSCALETIVEVM